MFYHRHVLWKIMMVGYVWNKISKRGAQYSNSKPNSTNFINIFQHEPSRKCMQKVWRSIKEYSKWLLNEYSDCVCLYYARNTQSLGIVLQQQGEKPLSMNYNDSKVHIEWVILKVMSCSRLNPNSKIFANIFLVYDKFGDLPKNCWKRFYIKYYGYKFLNSLECKTWENT